MLSAKERALLFREVGDMLRSGLPVERGITVAAKSRKDKTGALLEMMAGRLRRGDTLEEAFEAAERKHPGNFAPWETRFIGFGEKAGQLPDFLLQIADQAEESWSLAMELISSCAYPLLLLYISILVGPLASLILQGPWAYLSQVSGPLVFVTAVLGGLVIALRHTVSRRFIVRTVRPIPVLGRLVWLTSLLRMLSGLALAYRAGIPISEAWTLAGEASDDPTLLRISKEARHRVEHVGEVAPLLDRHPDVFPKEVRTAYRAGEETGRLDTELLHVAKFMRGELETARQVAAKMVNTVFYLIVLAQMAKNALNMYGPALDIINNAQQGF